MPYEFTQDFFTSRIPVFERLLAEFKGKPNVQFLEIGSFEGMSALWMADNILTGDDSWITCVDSWSDYAEMPGIDMAEVGQRFMRNISHKRIAYRDSTIQPVFCEWSRPRGFDFIYIDGSHRASDVLTDSVFAWEMLKVGGLMAWDDIDWAGADYQPWDKPMTAVTAFIACHRDSIEILHDVGQMWIRRTK